MSDAAAEADQGSLSLFPWADMCCANCGAAEVDDVKLEERNDCDLVKYCNNKCREKHRELQLHLILVSLCVLLRDRRLFTQPDETHIGECPICFLPMLLGNKSMLSSCCSKIICKGCVYANRKSGGGSSCPFCREPQPKKGENHKRMKKRVKANDPAALRQMGGERYYEGDYYNAFKYLTKAAELGDSGAHYLLGMMYWKGQFVEKNEDKAAYHWEKAAIGGHPQARHELAVIEEESNMGSAVNAIIGERNGNIERAVKHYIIAANLGYEKSMKALRKHYSLGNITKEDLDATLLSHQAALDAAKSEQREEAEIAWQLLQRLEDELAKSEQREEAEEVSRLREDMGLGVGLMAHIYG